MTWSLEERKRGLSAVVLAGSSLKASDLVGIPSSTLREWIAENREEYERLREELEPQVVKKIAAEAETLVLRIAEREAQILDALDEHTIGKMEGKDLAGTLRNLSTSKALQVDKVSSPLRERPSHVQHGQNVEELVHRMARFLGESPQTIVDATVVDESPGRTLMAESGELNAHGPQSASPSPPDSPSHPTPQG
jgi:transposase